MKRVLNTIVGFITFMAIGFIVLGGTKLAVNAMYIEPNRITTTKSIDNSTDDKDNDNTVHTEQYLNEFNDARDALAIEVHEYISTIAPRAEIDPYILIDLCTKYNIDVAFVLAQGQIESHYATAGTAKRTNSIFNVGAYDGHSASKQSKNGFAFKHPNDSIEPYLILLTSDYLVNGKTVNDLMRNYVNKHGMRYASNRQYEAFLRSTYNKIYNIPGFRNAYKEYKECLVKIC